MYMKFCKLIIRIFSFFLFLVACTGQNKHPTDKVQAQRDNTINVNNKIIDIKTNVLFGPSELSIIDDVLIVDELQPSGDKGIHLFDKKTFQYITSTAFVGKGPGEVTRSGGVKIDYKNRIIWLSDHGKMVLWKFPLDSILNNEKFYPKESIVLPKKFFIERFGFLNDSIVIGKVVNVLSNNSFDMKMIKQNLKTMETESFGYEHPEATGKKSNSFFKLSTKNNIYINCYPFCDLLTICDLQGNLKCNVWGKDRLDNKGDKKDYYRSVDVIDNKIIASYLGDVGVVFNEYGRPQGNLPTKFLIFDFNGNYLQTIETENEILFFCVDEDNSRIIAYFANRKNPLGYFELNKI